MEGAVVLTYLAALVPALAFLGAFLGWFISLQKARARMEQRMDHFELHLEELASRQSEGRERLMTVEARAEMQAERLNMMQKFLIRMLPTLEATYERREHASGPDHQAPDRDGPADS